MPSSTLPRPHEKMYYLLKGVLSIENNSLLRKGLVKFNNQNVKKATRSGELN